MMGEGQREQRAEAAGAEGPKGYKKSDAKRGLNHLNHSIPPSLHSSPRSRSTEGNKTSSAAQHSTAQDKKSCSKRFFPSPKCFLN